MLATRQVIISLLVVVVAVAGWYFLAPKGDAAGVNTNAPAAQGAARPGGARNITPTVVTEPVTFEAVTDELHAVGSAAAVNAVTLFPQVTGIITEVAFRGGDQVAAGQTLFKIDDQTQAIAVERARIAAQDAKAALARAEQLADSKNISAVTLEQARSTAAQADIDLRAAELELSRRTVKAPFAGVVGIPTPTAGDMVTTQTALATIDDVSAFTVTFDAPERFVTVLKLGDPVTATSPGLPGTTMRGEVSAVDSRVDVNTRTFRVEARLDEGIAGLKSGMSVIAQLSFPQGQQPSVPSLAIQWDRSGPFVWRVENDKAQRTPVQILSRRSGVVFVAGKLNSGDAVVVEGVQRLRDGISVVRSSDSVTSAPSASNSDAGG
jgi:RND family efflux transporter MFP subunit